MHDQIPLPHGASPEGSDADPPAAKEEPDDDPGLHPRPTSPRLRLSAIQIAATHEGDAI
jgi:hypothetical protein